jgi:cell division protein FtsB
LQRSASVNGAHACLQLSAQRLKLEAREDENRRLKARVRELEIQVRLPLSSPRTAEPAQLALL